MIKQIDCVVCNMGSSDPKRIPYAKSIGGGLLLHFSQEITKD